MNKVTSYSFLKIIVCNAPIAYTQTFKIPQIFKILKYYFKRMGFSSTEFTVTC